MAAAEEFLSSKSFTATVIVNDKSIAVRINISFEKEHASLINKDVILITEPVFLLLEKLDVPVEGENLILIISRKDNAYKLVHSNNPVEKLKQLQEGSRSKLEILACCAYSEKFESELYKKIGITIDEAGWFELEHDQSISILNMITEERVLTPVNEENKENNTSCKKAKVEEVKEENKDDENIIGPSKEEEEKIPSISIHLSTRTERWVEPAKHLELSKQYALCCHSGQNKEGVTELVCTNPAVNALEIDDSNFWLCSDHIGTILKQTRTYKRPNFDVIPSFIQSFYPIIRNKYNYLATNSRDLWSLVRKVCLNNNDKFVSACITEGKDIIANFKYPIYSNIDEYKLCIYDINSNSWLNLIFASAIRGYKVHNLNRDLILIYDIELTSDKPENNYSKNVNFAKIWNTKEKRFTDELVYTSGSYSKILSNNHFFVRESGKNSKVWNMVTNEVHPLGQIFLPPVSLTDGRLAICCGDNILLIDLVNRSEDRKIGLLDLDKVIDMEETSNNQLLLKYGNKVSLINYNTYNKFDLNNGKTVLFAQTFAKGKYLMIRYEREVDVWDLSIFKIHRSLSCGIGNGQGAKAYLDKYIFEKIIIKDRNSGVTKTNIRIWNLITGENSKSFEMEGQNLPYNMNVWFKELNNKEENKRDLIVARMYKYKIIDLSSGECLYTFHDNVDGEYSVFDDKYLLIEDKNYNKIYDMTTSRREVEFSGNLI